MANPERGEVTLKVGDRDYVLVFDFEAYCQAEELMSVNGAIVPITEIFMGAAAGSFRHIRALMYGVTRSHQPELSAKAVGQMIVDAGGPVALLGLIKKLRTLSELEGKKKRPPQARPQKSPKAGARTSSTRDASASRPATSGG